MAGVTTDIDGLLPHRACRNCMQIKVKCIPRDDQSGRQRLCERCYRLGKNCTTPAPVVRKKRVQNTSKVAQLEDRINRLSNLLTPIASPEGTGITTSSKSTSSEYQHETYSRDSRQSGNHLGQHETSDDNPSQHEDVMPLMTCVSQKPRQLTHAGASGDSDVRLSSVIAPPHLFLRDGTINTPADLFPMYLDPQLEQQLFEDYREQWSRYLPFVLIPEDTETRTVKVERPFVYWCAIGISSMTRRDLSYALNEQLLKCIGDQLLVKSHKSLDALQGLLILLTWYHYYAHMKPQTANLLHLAQALAIDLGFTRTSGGRHNIRIATDLADMYHGKQVISGIQSSDDKRALLGLFWCVSRMSLCFPRIEPMAFTSHMERCCQELEAAVEFSSDAWLVHAVRLQKIVGRYHFGNHSHSEVPLSFLKKGLIHDLDEFVASLPSDMPDRTPILLEVEGCKFSLMGPGRPGNWGQSLESADLLHAALRAMESFTAQLEDCPPQQYIVFPVWYFFISFISGLAEMCFLHADCWDLESVRRNFGFDRLMQRHVVKLDECRKYGKDISSSDLAWRFALYSEKTRRSIKWYETKVSRDKPPVAASDAAIAASGLPDLSDSLYAELADPLWYTIMGDIGDWSQSFLQP